MCQNSTVVCGGTILAFYFGEEVCGWGCSQWSCLIYMCPFENLCIALLDENKDLLARFYRETWRVIFFSFFKILWDLNSLHVGLWIHSPFLTLTEIAFSESMYSTWKCLAFLHPLCYRALLPFLYTVLTLVVISQKVLTLSGWNREQTWLLSLKNFSE